jgi:two-component sensor histidine kinase
VAHAAQALLAIPSPSQLAEANAQLRKALEDLEAVRQGLEAEVRRRTEEVQALARRFEIATDGSVITVCEQDAELRYTWLHNPRPPLTAEAVGRTDAEVLAPQAAAALAERKARVLATGEPSRGEVSLPVAGENFSFEVKITPARVAGGGDGLLVAAVDITQQKREQAHLQVIMRELAHRAKNLLSLVAGVARQTARAEAVPEGFVDRFTARLAALGGAYDLLIGQDWRGVELGALVKAQLDFILPDARERVAVEGPAVVVRPEVGQYLALALHELATNAVKYGPLRAADGGLSVRWRLAEGEAQGGSMVEFEWSEHGTEFGDTGRKGFGRSLLERIVPRALGAAAGLDLSPPGARWRIVFAA